MPSRPQPDIAILGGGIGGLAAAAFLRREGLRATLYEQAPALTEVGAGLVVAPNAGRLLRRLGVMDRFLSEAVKLDVGWEFRRWEDGRVLSAEDLETRCEDLYGEHTYTAHRAHLLDTIRSAVPMDWLRLGAKCVEVSTLDARPRLRFADGSVADHDILIGADGMHSTARSLLHGDQPATPSGIMAFRALVPAQDAPAFAHRRAQTLWIGPGRHLVHYPVSGGRMINLVAFAPSGDFAGESWTATATVTEFLQEFDGWDPRVSELIAASEAVGRWALLDRAPLECWSQDRIALLGDAAHPMFPFFAQGAAQAIEDGAVLAASLAADRDDPARALRHYEQLRRGRTARIQTVSHGRAHINHLPDGAEQEARDSNYSASDPLTTNGWIYGYDPNDAIDAGAEVAR